MPSITSLGVGSGLDLTTLLKGLERSESSRLEPIKIQEKSYTNKLDGYNRLSSALEGFQGAVDALADPALYESKSITTTSTAFSATSGTDAQEGNYSIKVQNLASAQSLATTGQASRTDTIGTGGNSTLTLSITDGAGNVSSTTDIALDSTNSSLEGIRDAINTADAGVTASIINDGSGTPYRLVMTSDKTGESSQINMSVTNDDILNTDTSLQDLLNYNSADNSGNLTETSEAKNANLEINGLAITSDTNTVEEAIQGVTLTLNSVNDTAENMVVAQDDGTIREAFETLVSSYNSMQDLIDIQTSYDAESKSSNGSLLGESTVRSIQNQIRGAFNTSVSGDSLNYLTQAGISLNKDGKLEIDDTRFDKAMTDVSSLSTLMIGADGESGVTSVLSTTLGSMLDEGGVLDTVTGSIDSRLESLKDRKETIQKSIDSTVDRYRKQFNDLDLLLSNINSTSSYLSQQLSALNTPQN
ncbi:flagellar filament capping protein FliD [Larsenimonas rhizosphaerae]|uniref:flagellar filament capping protein FliD n=1 Tax=Larsenimonas rhizosphaerae TaxID=2944682 RepID=UPI002033C267|nr:flagellar filament capping protein FliD [Larsenimonas rhizosphaerae]MCM2130473.1 flagellar filament capping protein FliD [Larsenimonas rhizosphaerae]